MHDAGNGKRHAFGATGARPFLFSCWRAAADYWPDASPRTSAHAPEDELAGKFNMPFLKCARFQIRPRSLLHCHFEFHFPSQKFIQPFLQDSNFFFDFA